MILRCRRRCCFFFFYWFCPRGPCPQYAISVEEGSAVSPIRSGACLRFTSLAKTHLSRFDERIPSVEQCLRLR